MATDCLVVLNRCKASSAMIKSTASKEFDLLKRIRLVTDQRIIIQKRLMDKIKRGKFKYREDLALDAAYSLAKHDLKILENAREDFEKRTSVLRQRTHAQILGDCRSQEGISDD